MVDTGFYRHPFHIWHGYQGQAALSPGTSALDDDQIGHGTGQSANVFACAPGAQVVVVKMGSNPTSAFKQALELNPAIISLSWGYELAGETSLPNYLRPLESAVLSAVHDRGIVVCCSGGNGEIAFPASMPDVIAVGGVYAAYDIGRGKFELQASDFTSSFDSLIYPGRHVPDICGLVGMSPRSIYLTLPVPVGSDMDKGFAAGGSYPGGDETLPDDGWAIASGTSSAAPQVAGICALLKEAQPGIAPSTVKAILQACGRQVLVGKTAQGQLAGPGLDAAAGAGLADAERAYRLALSAGLRKT
jgi:subtilisin family serine protease